jgi:hypothetical protein
MMRPDTEVPSDFQDYTLVALIGVAVHLSGASPSEPAVLPTLVRTRAFASCGICFLHSDSHPLKQFPAHVCGVHLLLANPLRRLVPCLCQ